MEFNTLMEKRYSCRQFSDEPVSEADLAELLKAANAAPVGSARYMDLHMTVVQDREILNRLTEALFVRVEQRKKEMAAIVETVESQKSGNLPKDPFYGAPVVIFISHKKQDLQPGIEWCNVMDLAMYIHLKATDLGLGSCFGWGVLESERMFPEYDHNEILNLPEGFEPLIAIVVGHAAKEAPERTLKVDRITVNYL